MENGKLKINLCNIFLTITQKSSNIFSSAGFNNCNVIKNYKKVKHYESRPN